MKYTLIRYKTKEEEKIHKQITAKCRKIYGKKLMVSTHIMNLVVKDLAVDNSST